MSILKIIDTEDKKNPYTDQELAELLELKRAEIISLRKKYSILDSRERRKSILIQDIIDVLQKNSDLSERKITEILVSKGYNISRSGVTKIIKEENLLEEISLETKNENKRINSNTFEESTYTNKKTNTNLQEKEDGFEELIGINGSLKTKVNLAKSAIMYPPNGLHTMIYGETGVGKSQLASCMHKYAIKNNIRKADSPFIIFNCADYAENPNLLISQLFGVQKGAYTGADSNREGLVEKANGGILFLDEIHRLPSAGQEILFSLIDRGEFRRLGESNWVRKANVLIIGATTENLDSNILQTFRRRIPMVIELPNLSQRPISERYEIITKFFEVEAKRVDKNFMITKEAMSALLRYNCVGNIGQLKSDIQVTCARAYSKAANNNNIIIDLDNLRKFIRTGYLGSQITKEEEQLKLDDIYIDIGHLSDKTNKVLSTTQISELYNFAERELKILQNKCEDADELQDLFMQKLDQKFKEIKGNRNLSDRRKFIKIENQIEEPTLKIMDKIMIFLKKQYKHINQSMYLALAVHLDHAITRIKEEKTIINPSLDKIQSFMPQEYELSRYIVGILEEDTGLSFPEDELGYLAYYINNFCFNEEMLENVKVVIVTHGKVGIEMAEVVNYILGIDSAIGLEIDLFAPSHEGIDNVIEEIKKINAPKGILLLVDMGSLVILGDELEKRIGTRCKTISRVDTLLALESAKLANIQRYSLDEIMNSLNKNKNHAQLPKASYRENENIVKSNGNNENIVKLEKNKIIISVCLTGVGTALKIKEHIQGLLNNMGENIEVRPLGFFGKDLESELKEIEENYEIILICGTINIGYQNSPFVSYYDILGNSGQNKLSEYINPISLNQTNKSKQNLIHEDLVLFDFEGVSKEYTIDTLVSKLELGGYVDSKYILSVYKRELMGSVVIQQKVAAPHGLPEHVIKPAIAVAKLNKPIIWDEEYMVNMVVLLALKEDNKQEIRDLVSKIHNPDSLEAIMNSKNTKELIEKLTE